MTDTRPPSAADLLDEVAAIICMARMGVTVSAWDEEYAQQAIEVVAGACAAVVGTTDDYDNRHAEDALRRAEAALLDIAEGEGP